MLCLFKGPADPVHLPGNGVHQHSDHLQRHPQGGHCTADHAHSEILLLGCEPTGPQRSCAQRPRWARRNTLHAWCLAGLAHVFFSTLVSVWGSFSFTWWKQFSSPAEGLGRCLSSRFVPVFSDGSRPNQKEILSLRAFLLLFVKQLIMKVTVKSRKKPQHRRENRMWFF